MEVAALFLLALVGVVLAAPIFALVGASRAQRRAESAERELASVRGELDELRRRIERANAQARAVDGRLTAWVTYFQAETREAAPAASPVVATGAAPDAAVPLAVAPPDPTPHVVAPDATSPVAEAPVAAPLPDAEPAAEPAVAPRSRYREARARHAGTETPPVGGSTAESSEPFGPAGFDWERLVGVRLFAWLGGGALFLAAALFLHYSIQQNLISPPVRVATGLGVGALALLAGDRLRARARYAGDAISGAGVAILYAALFAARVLYDLIPNPAAFAGMILVTVTAGFIAVKRSAFFVALLGLLGGMATPYLLSTGQDRPLVLFAYVTLLSAGVVVVARIRQWPSLALVGLACSTILFAGWANKYLVAERTPYALLAVAVVAALFAFVRVERPRSEENDLGSGSLSLQRLLVGAATVLPLASAVVLAGSVDLGVDPRVLAPYLLVVSGGAFISDLRQGSRYLTVAAAVLAALALAVRAGADLFPEQALLALGSFALVPAGFLAMWLARRKAPEELGLRVAAVVTLVGAFPIVLILVDADPRHEAFRLALAYAWVHAAGVLAIGVLRREGALFAVAHAIVLLSVAALTRGDPTRWKEFVLAAGASGAVLWALPLLHARTRPDRMAWWSAAAALPLHFLLIYGLARDSWGGGPLGGSAVACAVLCAVSLRVARAHGTAHAALQLELSALYGGLTLAFVTASVPLLLENEWLTISWAAEVAALAWLRRRVPHDGLILALALLAAGVSVRLLANPALWEYHERSATPIFNYYLYTFGVPALSFLAAQRMLAPFEVARRFRLPALLAFVATVLLFVLMNVEIADYYSTGTSLTFRLSGGGLAEDMTYSLAWGSFALALLLVGMAARNRATRIGALVVLVLTVGKVFLHDLWELGSLYRVGSIVGLAVALLGVSFLTQRFVLPKEER